MKQIMLIGDLARWQPEAEFIHDMLSFTGVRVITVNLGNESCNADLNRADVQYLFDNSELAVAIEKMTKKFYAQGIVDGVLFLSSGLKSDTSLHDAVFSGFPFGIPKFLVGDPGITPLGGRDIVKIPIPGSSGNFNSVRKITLSNAVFALSGMTLNNICNYGSAQPLVGVITSCNQNEINRKLQAKGLNYIGFDVSDPLLPQLIKDGFIHGILIIKDTLPPILIEVVKAGGIREIPLVIGCKDPFTICENLPDIGAIKILHTSGKSPVTCKQISFHPINCVYANEKFFSAAIHLLRKS
ncbi:MAG: hypothetical protein FH749_06180, partial [Firmicutes bacterium]|nr:hypothetical protein [Bacillota bacterium]